MTKFYICRHGNTFEKHDIVTRVGARTDLPLSSSGIGQAKSLGQAFMGLSFHGVFSSPLKRTLSTAEIILEMQAHPPPIEIRPFLREIDYGPDENKPEEEVIKRVGADALAAWDAKAIPPDGWQVDPVSIRRAWLEFISQEQTSKDSNILVTTSNGIARFILDIAHSCPPNSARKLKTGAYAVLSLDSESRIIIERWNAKPD